MKFLSDFFSSFFYFIQNGIFYTLHIGYHFIFKVFNFIERIVLPICGDFIYGTLFIIMVIYQGFCFSMTLFCINMGTGFIKMGKFFNYQSEKLIMRNWM